MEIIDFHTHPFTKNENNICAHIPNCNMSVENTRELFRTLGVSRICGSVLTHVLTPGMTRWEQMQLNNNIALELWESYGDFYIPGIHVHPSEPIKSCEEIERLYKKGVKLIGELVPYFYDWNEYGREELDEIFALARDLDMVVNVHPTADDDMDELVRRHPDTVIVAAHPGEYGEFTRHMERMKLSENYYLDLSGYGIFRHGMLRHAIDLFGPERFLFGSDYPTCNPAMYIGGVMLDPLITDAEKELIMSGNAKRLLGL